MFSEQIHITGNVTVDHIISLSFFSFYIDIKRCDLDPLCGSLNLSHNIIIGNRLICHILDHDCRNNRLFAGLPGNGLFDLFDSVCNFFLNAGLADSFLCRSFFSCLCFFSAGAFRFLNSLLYSRAGLIDLCLNCGYFFCFLSRLPSEYSGSPTGPRAAMKCCTVLLFYMAESRKII